MATGKKVTLPMMKIWSDVVVIGGGHEGCAAAIRAAQKGLKSVCIEVLPTLGGPLPPKALLQFSGAMRAPGYCVEEMIAKRDKAADCLTKGMMCTFRKYGVDHIKGFGSFFSPNQVCVTEAEGKVVVVQGRHIIIATGSTFRPSASFISRLDNKVVSSRKALSLPDIPKRAVVIGSSYMSLEVASMWARLGSDVTVVDLAHDILPTMDGEIRKKLQSILEKHNLKFMLKTKVVEMDSLSSRGVKVTVQPGTGSQHSTLETDVVLVPDWRVPNTTGLHLDRICVDTDVNSGGIMIDEQFMTSMPQVYAIGDVATARPMLDCHKASKEAAQCVKFIAAKGLGRTDFDKMPGVLYTDPEVASVGMTEEQLKARGLEYQAHITEMQNDEGIAKILEDKRTNKVLGAHIISRTAESRITDVLHAMVHRDARYVVARTALGPTRFVEGRPRSWSWLPSI